MIDKRYAAELRAKSASFRSATRSKKVVLLTMVTSYGVRKNTYRDELVAASIEMGALFSPLPS